MVYKIILGGECPAAMEGPTRGDPAEKREDELDTAQKCLDKLKELMQLMQQNKLELLKLENDALLKQTEELLAGVDKEDDASE